MHTEQHSNYERIAQAMAFIQSHFKEQPCLEEVAQHVNLSPFHFQRLFSEWAGTSPKKFLQYTTIAYAKSLLKENQASLFDTAIELGLSGTSRLHDLFVTIEGMTPAEYKNGGENLFIRYCFEESPFGRLLAASTVKGVCWLAFIEDETEAFAQLQSQFAHARFEHQKDTFQEQALQLFSQDWNHLTQVKLHLKGTEFQLKVWEALLKIPMGRLRTYGALAKQIESPKAARAVGTAIGSNPVAFLIPCHRVIQASGVLGGYMWGSARKAAIIAWEGAKTDKPSGI